MIILNHFCGITYRALGKPKLSTISEWLHILFLWPAVVVAAYHGFESLYITRTLIRLQHIVVDLFLMYYIIKFPISKMILNIMPATISSLIIALLVIIFNLNQGGILFQIFIVIVCFIIYLFFLCFFKNERKLVYETFKKGYEKFL